MIGIDEVDEVEVEDTDVIGKLVDDLKKASRTLGPREARFLVDTYYTIQRQRIRAGQQALSMKTEPHKSLDWFADTNALLELQIKLVLDKYSKQGKVGQWLRSVKGIGPVTASGLLANLIIRDTVGAWWRFAGLDPTSQWIGSAKARTLVDEVVFPGAKDSSTEPTEEHYAAVAEKLNLSPVKIKELTLKTAGDSKPGLKHLAKAAARCPWNARLKVLCVTPDQHVQTRRGFIPISEVAIGDEVLTHKGRFRKVLKVFSNDYTGPTFQPRLFGMGNGGPVLTAGHPVYTTNQPVCHYVGDGRKRWRRGPAKRQSNFEVAEKCRSMVAAGSTQREAAKTLGVSEAAASHYIHGRMVNPIVEVGWRAVEFLTPGMDLYSPETPDESRVEFLEMSMPGAVSCGERLRAEGRWPGVPHPLSASVPKVVEVTEDLAYVIGLFLAEGHTSGNHIGWSFHSKEEKALGAAVETALTEVFGIGFGLNRKPKANCIQIMATSKIISKTFSKMFGSGAKSKRIPAHWVSQLPARVLEKLLDGVFDGDGYINRGARMLTTISPQLAMQVRASLLRLGRHASVSKYSDGTFKVREQKSSPSGRKGEAGFWHPVSTLIKTDYSGKVYNLEVEEDHSYVVEGIAVHNCWKIGESFVKVSGKEDAYYGQVYLKRKEYESAKNLTKAYADQARRILETKKIGKTTEAYKAYSVGMLPLGHIHARCKRYAVKLFLAHLHEVMFTEAYGKPPPLPYPIRELGHIHFLPVPQPGDKPVPVDVRELNRGVE